MQRPRNLIIVSSVQICKQLKSMKIPVYIILSMALVWFGGAGLAFASCPLAQQPMPACPCHQSHGESGRCCDSHTPQKGAPACSANLMPISSCACNFNRGDSSPATAVSAYSSANPAIISDSTIVTIDSASNANTQTYQALPSFSTPLTLLRI
jgi:hypothetical protein